MATRPHFASFSDFWPYYVREHSRPLTQWCHFLGTNAAAVILLTALVAGKWPLVLIGLLVGYGLAFASHYAVQRNRPATLQYPLWSLLGDLRMTALLWQGRLGSEVQRVLAAERS